ncbi:MAG: CAP domain-containing protein [Dehalococcoidia bacterium]|jgi:uncharacterized protein YkwD
MKSIKLFSVLIIGVLILGSVASCSQEDLQEQVDILTADLVVANEQLAALQQKLVGAEIVEGQYDELSAEYDDLKDQNDANLEEMESLGVTIESLGDEITELTNTNDAQAAQIETLQTEYDSLKAQYDLLLNLEADITEENIANALFDLINQERIAHGLNALDPGHNLEEWSLSNCQAMAVSKKFETYSVNYVPFQRVFIAAGYSSLDRIVNAVMMTWQSHPLSYNENILNEDALYGAVSVVESGGIYYITYMASDYP